MNWIPQSPTHLHTEHTALRPLWWISLATWVSQHKFHFSGCQYVLRQQAAALGYCLHQVKILLWKHISVLATSVFRICGSALFRDSRWFGERASVTKSRQTTRFDSWLFILLCLFVAGGVSVCLNWVCEWSPISFRDCKGVAITSLAMQRSAEWACRKDFAGFKAPQSRQ